MIMKRITKLIMMIMAIELIRWMHRKAGNERDLIRGSPTISIKYHYHHYFDYFNREMLSIIIVKPRLSKLSFCPDLFSNDFSFAFWRLICKYVSDLVIKYLFLIYFPIFVQWLLKLPRYFVFRGHLFWRPIFSEFSQDWESEVMEFLIWHKICIKYLTFPGEP